MPTLNINSRESLGRYAAQINDATTRAENENIIQHLWQKQGSAWKSDAKAQESISSFLGWLNVADFVRPQLASIEAFAKEVKAAGFTHAVLCGMGGSSLCPEVFRRVFQDTNANDKADNLKLLVLDSTDPDTVADVTRRAPLAKTLFIIASKSGSTVEPLSFYKYFYKLAEDFYQSGAAASSGIGTHAGDHFIAITDEGTKMHKDAERDKFRRIFINPSDIGGRYSALSLFGIVPAALMGINVRELMTRADAAIAASKPDAAFSENQGARLGCIIGAPAAAKDANKLTLVTDERLYSLGLWVEQLLAESTGKEGKGIVPIAQEPLDAPESYGDDRVFVAVHVEDLSPDVESKLQALEAADFTVVRRRLSDAIDLGAEFFVWEIATSVAGWLLQINPYDQPNVQAAKDRTVRILDERKATGELPQQTAFVEAEGLALYRPQSESNDGEASSLSLDAAIANHFKQAKAGDYIALLAYLQESNDTDAVFREMRVHLRDKLKVATTFGYGPRYLHSTGQLHKGGPAGGVFVIITDDDARDIPVPETDYTFGILKQSQSLGDMAALADEKRRVLRVHLGKDAQNNLQKLKEIVEAKV